MSNKRVVHFEIPCDDVEKNMEFFKEAFGWQFQEYGDGEYWFAKTGEDGPGINGGFMKRRKPGQPVVNSISVPDIDASIADVEKAGGKIVVPKMPVPSMGWIAYFTDPDGNIHGIWQDDLNAK